MFYFSDGGLLDFTQMCTYLTIQDSTLDEFNALSPFGVHDLPNQGSVCDISMVETSFPSAGRPLLGENLSTYVGSNTYSTSEVEAV